MLGGCAGDIFEFEGEKSWHRIPAENPFRWTEHRGEIRQTGRRKEKGLHEGIGEERGFTSIDSSAESHDSSGLGSNR